MVTIWRNRNEMQIDSLFWGNYKCNTDLPHLLYFLLHKQNTSMQFFFNLHTYENIYARIYAL